MSDIPIEEGFLFKSQFDGIPTASLEERETMWLNVLRGGVLRSHKAARSPQKYSFAGIPTGNGPVRETNLAFAGR